MKFSQKFILIFAVMAFVSCKKGTCTCTILGTDLVTKNTYDSRSDYKDGRESCEQAGCKWSAGH